MVLKLLGAAVCLLVLAAYIGGRKSSVGTSASEPLPASASSTGAAVPSGPVILKPQGADGSASVRVGDAKFSVSPDGRTLFVEGGIGRRFSADLEQALAANAFLQRIVITSGGGYAGSGLDAAGSIRRRNLTVRVRSHCASMCVGLWASAAAREMEPDAVIGLHQWRVACDVLADAEQRRECEYSAQFWTAHEKSYEGWLRSAGFNDRLLQLQKQTPADQVALLNVPALRENGVDFRVVDPDGHYLNREQTRRFLLNKYGRRGAD
ncbi:hypothetical protein CSC70_07960 [Pseudoxanthomonas kalamensis DSM 18571]|uniref:hypothetical protein n=1 Tax=Pseudoxanthomonas kalamensis TaxID=289483 RepID=UPI001391EE01|nr:hypothetical protein [Pseudoxanthomonas kalamensis]KAF1710584.1 hypothetical protein CSC70_07960 [Pseudoxanthomonas kalamensis DSM 18571]